MSKNPAAFYNATLRINAEGKSRFHVTDRTGRETVMTVDLFGVMLHGLEHFPQRGVWDIDEDCWHRVPEDA
jgi:hypothetical protein